MQNSFKLCKKSLQRITILTYFYLLYWLFIDQLKTSIFFSGADCLLTCEWKSANKIIALCPAREGTGDIIVATASGGMGSCNVQVDSFLLKHLLLVSSFNLRCCLIVEHFEEIRERLSHFHKLLWFDNSVWFCNSC